MGARLGCDHINALYKFTITTITTTMQPDFYRVNEAHFAVLQQSLVNLT